MLNIQREILSLMPDIRRVVSRVLRSSRYYAEDHIDECMQDVMAQAVIYGARTFDASRGTAKAHFTCFAKSRAINWLNRAHRRFETVVVTIDSDDDTGKTEPLQTSETPFAILARKQEAAGIREAFEALQPRHRDLLAAFERTYSWGEAAKEIGVSPATASRMKAAIAAALR